MKKIDYKEKLKTFTILYVEDDANIRKNLSNTLDIIFYKVLSSSNAEDALVMYEENSVDIILSDINLPGINGLDFVKKIREQNQKIPIIMLSAYTNTDFLLEATKLKLVNYLTKPIDFDNLYDSFSLALDDILRDKPTIIKFNNNISYDTSSSILYENKIEKDLTQSERRLLELFLEKKGATVSVEQIKNNLWNDIDKATDSALKSLLNKLRQKVGSASIKNISGVGYHLVYND
jgi:DNA-binding response OmpR family regulator